MKDRIARLRNAHPELSVEQARGLLVAQYKTAEDYEGDIETIMDQFTVAMTQVDTVTLGRMLNYINL